MYIIISLILITIIIIYFFNNRRVEKVIIKGAVPKNWQEIKVPKRKIILQYSTDSIKHYFYNPSMFNSFMSNCLYKKVIVDQLWLEEPFHSTFVKILQIIDKSDSWVKSKRTKELKLKIRKNNSKYEQGISFKVYSLSDLSFDFTSNIFEYFKKNISTKKNIQNTLLASLLFNVNNVKEINHWCEKELTDDELRLCLVDIILKEYTHQNEVIHIFNLILKDDYSVQFILHIYNEVVRCQQEYPYVQKEKEELPTLDISYMEQENRKTSMPLSAFEC